MNILIGNKHNTYCDEDAIASFQIAVLSYHDKKLELGIYVHCGECDKLLGKTTATVTLDEQKTSD